MHSTTAFLSVAAMAAGTSLAGVSLDPTCAESYHSLIVAAPTVPADLLPYLASPLAPTTRDPLTLEDPEAYVKLLCSVAGELPSSLLSDFRSYGSALLSHGSVHMSEYDGFVTDCVTTGPAAAAITSYLNSILTATDPLCQPATTTSDGGLWLNTATTSDGGLWLPTATPTSTSAGVNSTIPTAGAPKPTGVLAGAAAIGGLVGVAALL